jgi:hypothetical protein
VRNDLRRSLPLLALFVLGLAAAIWIFASPWALGYPSSRGWTSSIWTSVWIGGILAVASSACLVTVLARAVHVALRAGRDGR